MILTCEQMRRVEQQAFDRGVSARELMEEAGAGIAGAICEAFPLPQRAMLACGKGNNAGDILVAGIHLLQAGWEVAVDSFYPEQEMSELSRHFLKILQNSQNQSARSSGRLRRWVILDGLLGIGAKGEPKGVLVEAIQKIQRARSRAGAFVVAADLPSGLDGDTGIPSTTCVQADMTVTIGYAKAGLVADTAAAFCGRIEVVPLAAFEPGEGDPAIVMGRKEIQSVLPVRSPDTHKGRQGRIGIYAGSKGFAGAARLCSSGAARAGAGLVSLLVPPEIYDLVAANAGAEVMVHPSDSPEMLLDGNFDAIAMGPGIGSTHRAAVLRVIREAELPCVVDADALNLLAGHLPTLRNIKGPRLLTPHPGEMDRLDPAGKDAARRIRAESFVRDWPVTLLLKGSRTLVAERNKPVAFNTTGNPGMASGGMGDVLTGVSVALAGQGLALFEAACAAAWICGKSADLALGLNESEESLLASDVIHHLGMAFRAGREQLNRQSL
jgi:hydroxyethylthiazole kinase-like uncharacterized protein yjeF